MRAQLAGFCEIVDLAPSCYSRTAKLLGLEALWIDPADGYFGCGNAHLLPRLKWILTNTTDTGHVRRLAEAKGIEPVSLQGLDLSTVRSTAEYTRLLIELALRPRGRTQEPGQRLRTAKVLIVGTHQGRIGRVARQLAGMFAQPDGPKYCSVTGPEGLRQYGPLADCVTLNLPALPQYRGLINRDTLRLLKRGAALVNTARDSLVDMDAVLEALDSGQLRSYATDFLTGHEHPRLIQSDHVAGYTAEDLERTQLMVINQWTGRLIVQGGEVMRRIADEIVAEIAKIT